VVTRASLRAQQLFGYEESARQRRKLQIPSIKLQRNCKRQTSNLPLWLFWVFGSSLELGPWSLDFLPVTSS
jgi:hypothetical protein